MLELCVNFTISGVPYPAAQMTLQDILSYSLNTGAVFLLEQLGGANTMNEQARIRWHDYLTNRYHFGQVDPILLPGEKTGYVSPPSGGHDIGLRYANSAFGIGLTVTPLQLVSAYAAIINGGTYYERQISADSQDRVAPIAMTDDVVSPEVSNVIRSLLINTLQTNNKAAIREGFMLGGKSGTAPVPGIDGSYRTDFDNGTYVGFVGRKSAKYIMLTRLDEPVIKEGFASAEAAKLWAEISNGLIDRSLIPF